jgi:hypothetical protein
VFVIDLTAVSCLEGGLGQLEDALHSALQSHNVTKVGFGLKHDFKVLHKTFPQVIL